MSILFCKDFDFDLETDKFHSEKKTNENFA